MHLQSRLPFAKPVLVIALVTAAGYASAAATVALTAFEALGSSAGPGTSVIGGLATGGDFFRNSVSGANSTFFHTYGYSTGVTYFGARVSGTGTFFGKTSATFADSYTNTSGAAQIVTFNFNVDSGQIDVAGTGTGYADLLLQLKFNGTVVARDHGRTDGSTCTVSDLDVGVLANYLSPCSGGGASGAAHAYSLSQLVADGATLNVEYSIVSEVSGSASVAGGQLCSNGPNGKGVGVAARENNLDFAAVINDPRYVGCANYYALARSGDPAGFTPFTPGSFGITAANDVPEPGSLGLAAMATVLSAVAVRRRRAS